MKMPALMTNKNAVIASNMATILGPAVGPNWMRPYTVKGFRKTFKFESAMMILCNTFGAAVGSPLRKANVPRQMAENLAR
jgi:hypothetical protein